MMVPRFDDEGSSWINGQSQVHPSVLTFWLWLSGEVIQVEHLTPLIFLPKESLGLLVSRRTHIVNLLLFVRLLEELHNQLSFIKMRGLMCRSVEVTSGCKRPETGNVVVPSRVLGRNESPSTRLIELQKVKFGERQEADASRRSMSLITKPSGSKRSGQGHVDTSSEIAMRMATRTVNASDDVFQVVVLRVSLHCQGCAGKLKKHLARMEGVTSFSIDLEEKRVTVRGHVLPAVVLESVSKVKRAEFWTSFHDQLIN